MMKTMMLMVVVVVCCQRRPELSNHHTGPELMGSPACNMHSIPSFKLGSLRHSEDRVNSWVLDPSPSRKKRRTAGGCLVLDDQISLG